MLGLFGIEPRTIRFKPKGEPHSTAKGYYRKDLVAGAAAAQIQLDVEPSRNPLTHSAVESGVPSRSSTFRILPQPSPCSGCRDMHTGIAEMAKVNPSMSDEELAAKSGCSVIIVRQAKARYLDWNKESE